MVCAQKLKEQNTWELTMNSPNSVSNAGLRNIMSIPKVWENI